MPNDFLLGLLLCLCLKNPQTTMEYPNYFSLGKKLILNCKFNIKNYCVIHTHAWHQAYEEKQLWQKYKTPSSLSVIYNLSKMLYFSSTDVDFFYPSHWQCLRYWWIMWSSIYWLIVAALKQWCICLLGIIFLYWLGKHDFQNQILDAENKVFQVYIAATFADSLLLFLSLQINLTRMWKIF